jgi:hypothetical protein
VVFKPHTRHAWLYLLALVSVYAPFDLLRTLRRQSPLPVKITDISVIITYAFIHLIDSELQNGRGLRLRTDRATEFASCPSSFPSFVSPCRRPSMLRGLLCLMRCPCRMQMRVRRGPRP